MKELPTNRTMFLDINPAEVHSPTHPYVPLKMLFEDVNGSTHITEVIEGEQISVVLKLFSPVFLLPIEKLHRNSLLRLKEILEGKSLS